MMKASFLIVLLGTCLGNALSLDVCTGQPDYTLLLHPADCSKYIICRNGETRNIQACAEGKHFNRLTTICDTPIEAACDVTLIKKSWIESGDCSVCRSLCGCQSESECPTTTPCPETTTPVTPSSPETPSPAPPSPGTSEAPPPQTPTPETPTPEPPSTGTPCTPVPETPSPQTPTPVTPVTPSPDTPSPGTPETPSPETPTQGTQSPPPQTPSPETPSPETPSPVTPSPETPATPSPVTPSCTNNLQICVGKPDYSNVYVSGSCQEYAICVSGCATVLTCPNNLIYNLVTRICDYPQNVNCPYPLNPPSGPSAGPSGTSCQQHGRCEGQADGTVFPVVSSNGYVVCQCECEIERPCPAGLVFNDKLLVCDYPATRK